MHYMYPLCLNGSQFVHGTHCFMLWSRKKILVAFFFLFHEVPTRMPMSLPGHHYSSKLRIHSHPQFAKEVISSKTPTGCANCSLKGKTSCHVLAL